MSGLANIARVQPQASHKQPQLRINGRNKTAIDAMVWEGLKRSEAAAKAGLTDHALYVALTKPHVRSYYLQQLDVLRTSERARNIHTLAEVRDQDSNQMARVAAVKALEQLDDDETGSKRGNSLPGLQIVVVTGSAAQPATIDVSPKALAHD